MKKLSLILILMIFVSCGKSIEALIPEAETQEVDDSNAVSELYTYEFRNRSCYTGEQARETFVQICEALKDDALNNDCAKDKREELFVNSTCPGSFI